MDDPVAILKSRLGFAPGATIHVDAAAWGGAVGRAVRMLQPSGRLDLAAVTEVPDTSFGHSAFVFEAKTDLHGLPGLKVTAAFLSDGEAAVRVVLRIAMTLAVGSPAWTFRDLFPGLPSLSRLVKVDFDTSSGETDEPTPPHSALDDFEYDEPALLVSSGAASDANFHRDPVTGAALQPGLNFVSRVSGSDPVGMLQTALFNLLGSAPPVLAGTIRIPEPSDVCLMVPWAEFPWTIDATPPGIHLTMEFPGRLLENGNSALHSFRFHVYTPHDANWAGTDPARRSYRPLLAYTAFLELQDAAAGAAGPTLDLSTEVIPGYGRVLLRGVGDGFSLGRLAHLSGLTGTVNNAAFPPEFASILERLEDVVGRIELEEVVVSLDAQPPPFSVPRVRVTVGIRNEVLGLFGERLKLEDLGLVLHVEDPLSVGAGRRLRPGAFGTIRVCPDPGDPTRGVAVRIGFMQVELTPFRDALDLPVQGDTGWMIDGRLASDVQLHLGDLFAVHAPELHDLASNAQYGTLAIDELHVQGLPGHFYSLQSNLAKSASLDLCIAGQTLSFSNLQVYLQYSEADGAAAHVAGTLTVGDWTFHGGLDLPGGFDLRAEISTFTLRGALSTLSGQDIATVLPGTFDLAFGETVIMANARAGEGAFSLGTTIEQFGTRLFLEVGKESSGWGFAAGGRLDTASATDLKAIPALDWFVHQFGLHSFSLFVCTLSKPSEHFGDFDLLRSPDLGQDKLALPNAGANLPTRGFFLLAEFGQGSAATATAKDGAFGRLRVVTDFLQIDLAGTATVALHVGFGDEAGVHLLIDPGRIELRPPGPVTPPPPPWGTLEGYLSVGVDAGGLPSLALYGSLATTIHQEPVTFTLALVVSANGVIVGGAMDGSLRFSSVNLSEVGLVIGVDFEGIPSFGVTGQLDHDSLEAAFGIFFNSENPAQSLLFGSLSDFSLRDVVHVVAGAAHAQIAPDVDNALGAVKLLGSDPRGRPGRSSLHPFLLPDLHQAVHDHDLAAIAAAFATASGGELRLPARNIGAAHTALLLHVPADSGQDCWFLTDLTSRVHYKATFEPATKQYRVEREPQVYLCPEATTFPGLDPFPEGFQVSGIVSLFGYDFEASPISITRGQGIEANLTFPKISVVVRQTTFLEISNADGSDGPAFALRTFSVGSEGAYFHLSGRLSLLGLHVQLALDVVTSGQDAGLKVGFLGDIPGVVQLGLEGTLVSPANFGIETRFSLRIEQCPLTALKATWNKPLLDVACKAHVGIRDGDPFGSVDGYVIISDAKRDFPSFGLPNFDAPLADLKALVLTPVEDAVVGYLKQYGSQAATFFQEERILFEDGVQGFARALVTFWGHAVEEVPKILHDIDVGFDAIVRALMAAFPQASPAKVLAGLRQIEDDLDMLAKALAQIFPHLSAAELAGLLKTVSDDLEQVLSALRIAFPGLGGPLAFTSLSPFFAPLDVIRLVATVFSLSPDQIVQVAGKQVGVDALATLLNVLFPLLGPGGSLLALVNLTRDPKSLYLVLQSLGVSEPVAIVQHLAQVGCDPQGIADLLFSIPDMTLSVAGTALKSIGLPSNVVDGVMQVAGWPLAAIHQVVNVVLNPRTWNPEYW